ncbi:hypothetical protein COCNU_12G001010 [Cocos nucifera]|uniref:Uncharacterized protein n=1 Tax=Cocos nucifera TaxID=13894 RepID=A0A8K0IR63_COCNU|nr:hypothetical protein COCNU_12G001010 [Cocos nucifera]
MYDRCLHRYPALYGSDDHIQACMAELGVPLTRHPSFHRYDIYGDLLGLLVAHPMVPFVTLHPLDVVQPVFPSAPSHAAALRCLFDGPIRLDSTAIFHLSICYDANHLWTVSVSWGFIVQMVRGVMSPREMEMPKWTFLNWYHHADYTAYPFNTRPMARSPCQRPFVYYLSSVHYDPPAAPPSSCTSTTIRSTRRAAGRWTTPPPSSTALSSPRNLTPHSGIG